MSTFKRFEEIEAWKISRELERKIWRISTKGSFSKDFGLKDQINRATGSIMDNIAEGFGRGGNREFVNFLSYSRASNDEVRSQLYRAYDRAHIDEKLFNELVELSNSVGVKINNLIVYLRDSNYRGQKFNKR